MATYTDEDINASSKFAEANNTIRLIRRLYEKAPHLASWLQIEIRDATNDDFYIPSTLTHAAKIVTVKIDENLCNLLSCVPVKEKDVCNSREEASYYYVGDSDYALQCQPACFHTAAKITYTEDGKRSADTPQLSWNSLQNECRIVNSHIVSFLEKTFYRSDVKYELRVNDMPTGFSKIPSNNPYGAGFTYALNKTYCKYYDLQYDEKSGSCEMSVGDKILDAVIGKNLINVVTSSIRMLTNKGVPFELPKDLPTLPKTLPKTMTVDGWTKNINKDFVLPLLIDTKPRLAQANAFTDNNARRDAELSETSDMSNFMRTTVGLDIDTSKDKVLGVDDDGNILPPLGRAKRSTVESTAFNEKEQNEATPKHWTEKMRLFFVELLRMFTVGDTYLYIGIDITAQVALAKLKSLCVKVVESMSSFLAKGLVDITGSIGTKVLISGVKGMAVKLVAGMALRVASKFALAIAKILGAAASVIGWLLVGTMILDLIFTFWDPYGYNNMFPKEAPNDLMQSGELALRQALSSASANYTFENLVSTVLSEDDMLEIQLESLVDRLIYLDALVVNSEGSRIDKGPEINLQAGSKTDMDMARNAGMAERVRFNPINYEIYNDRFLSRVRINKYLNYMAGYTLIFAGIMMITRLPLIALVATIISLILLAIARLELQDDVLVDVIDKYRYKESKYDYENRFGYSLT